MNIEVRQPLRAQKTRYGIVDCDIHPKLTYDEMRPYLSNQWWSHLQTYGLRPRHGFAKTYPMPKITPQAARRDAWPPTGGLPGSDLAFLQQQLLDLYDMDYGILNPLSPTGQGDQNPDFSAAMAFASNEAQVARWASREKRLKASVVVPYENAEASRAEIRRRAGDKNYAQVFMLSRTAEAHGRRRYWPIYARAQELGLPLGIHVGGFGGHAPTGGGWPSYYAEEQQSIAHTMAAQLTSLVLVGIPVRFPKL
jgi:predicted TIM-barrel fold metal-dependent hydrolase